MSSKSNPGVLEDRMVPDTSEIGVNMLKYLFWAYSENFIHRGEAPRAHGGNPPYQNEFFSKMN